MGSGYPSCLWLIIPINVVEKEKERQKENAANTRNDVNAQKINIKKDVDTPENVAEDKV